MSAEPALKLLTAEEFYRLPEPPEGGKMELVCGRVVTHMPVGGEHGTIAVRIAARMLSFAETHDLGDVGAEVGFRLSEAPDTVRAPDAHFVRKERLPGGRMPRSYFPGPPDLAVEVVSPDDRDTDVQEKVEQYLAANTPRVWVVRPDQRTVTVYMPDGVVVRKVGDTLTSTDAGFAVEGFALPLDSLFS